MKCLLMLLLAAVMPALPAADPLPPRPAGVYILVRNSMLSQLDTVLAMPEVDGITYYTGVKIVAPAPGVYQFETIRKVLDAAAANHKKVTLSMNPGRWVPDWYYEAGVQKFNWVYDSKLVDPERTATVSPVPWDPKLLELLGELMTAAGKEFGDHPALLSIQVVGPSLANGLEANFIATPEAAAAAGYSRDQYIKAWQTMFDVTAQAFPKQYLAWGIHDAFVNGRDAVPGRTIRDWAFAKYGARLHLLACYLTHQDWFAPGNQAYDIWCERNREIPAGLQLMEIYAQKKYPPALLKAALDKGRAGNMDYVEIFAEDAVVPQYREVIRQFTREQKNEKQ